MEDHHHLCRSPLEHLHLKTQWERKNNQQLSKENKPKTPEQPQGRKEKKTPNPQNNQQTPKTNKFVLKPNNPMAIALMEDTEYQIFRPAGFGCRRKYASLSYVKGKQTKTIDIHLVHVKYIKFLKLLRYSISPGTSSSKKPDTEPP